VRISSDRVPLRREAALLDVSLDKPLTVAEAAYELFFDALMSGARRTVSRCSDERVLTSESSVAANAYGPHAGRAR
jgi:hypothetical protein